ncbi:MAG: ribulose-phosphate 3-epimerase [Deltaproteobacteria bacterium]|nr:ribulose-phosphate 3-epimerase [Deltaproteobacteria bacterium]
MARRQRKIAPSLLSADFTRLGEEVRAVEAGGADLIHFDVMDGHFVPNITVGPLVLAAVRKVTKLPLDAHLMIENPDVYIPEFAKAGANRISVHVENTPHLHRTLQLIRSHGAMPAVVLNPATPLAALEHLWSEIGMVLLMSVNPGFGGQSFIPSVAEKIRRCRELIDRHNPAVELEVDGGIKADNVEQVCGDAVDIVVAGSAVFESPDYSSTIRRLKGAG